MLKSLAPALLLDRCTTLHTFPLIRRAQVTLAGGTSALLPTAGPGQDSSERQNLDAAARQNCLAIIHAIASSSTQGLEACAVCQGLVAACNMLQVLCASDTDILTASHPTFTLLKAGLSSQVQVCSCTKAVPCRFSGSG